MGLEQQLSSSRLRMIPSLSSAALSLQQVVRRGSREWVRVGGLRKEAIWEERTLLLGRVAVRLVVRVDKDATLLHESGPE